MLLIGRYKIYLIQSEALTRSGRWYVISMEFLCSFLGRHFAGKPVVAPQNVGCFLELHWTSFIRNKKNWDSLGFWIPRCGFRIPGTGFHYLSVELGFWFQLLVGFRISWAVFWIPKPSIPDSIIEFFRNPDSTSGCTYFHTSTDFSGNLSRHND